jgi:hypothetical protein
MLSTLPQTREGVLGNHDVSALAFAREMLCLASSFATAAQRQVETERAASAQDRLGNARSDRALARRLGRLWGTAAATSRNKEHTLPREQPP